MGKYKISDLEKLSNIKSHTIRIWEQRYGLLEPSRTNTNIRFYDDTQLRKLLNVVSLINAGHKISHIGKLSISEIEDKVSNIIDSDIDNKDEAIINKLVSSGLTYNEELFNEYYNKAIKSYGIVDSYKKIFYPLLEKVGLLWRVNDLNPAQEHFISNLLKQKFHAGIDDIETTNKHNQNWLLFLPENDHHDIGLTIANIILKTNNKKVVNLGADVPLDNLIHVIENAKPTHLLMFLVTPQPYDYLNKILSTINKKHPDKKLIICCNTDYANNLTFKKNQLAVTSFDDFLKIAEK